MKVPIKIGTVTLVGYINRGFPMKGGNCFSIQHEGVYKRVVNFGYENLMEAVNRFSLHEDGVNVEVVPKSEGRILIIDDERIPQDWYFEKWCTTCCPARLLPYEMRRKHFADLRARGATWKKAGNGLVIQSVPMKAGPITLKPGWTIK